MDIHNCGSEFVLQWWIIRLWSWIYTTMLDIQYCSGEFAQHLCIINTTHTVIRRFACTTEGEGRHTWQCNWCWWCTAVEMLCWSRRYYPLSSPTASHLAWSWRGRIHLHSGLYSALKHDKTSNCQRSNQLRVEAWASPARIIFIRKNHLNWFFSNRLNRFHSTTSISWAVGKTFNSSKCNFHSSTFSWILEEKQDLENQSRSLEWKITRAEI